MLYVGWPTRQQELEISWPTEMMMMAMMMMMVTMMVMVMMMMMMMMVRCMKHRRSPGTEEGSYRPLPSNHPLLTQSQLLR